MPLAIRKGTHRTLLTRSPSRSLECSKHPLAQNESWSDDSSASLSGGSADTPRTELTATRFKNFVRKVRPPVGDVLTKIVVNVATEAAKKAMGIQ